MIRTGIISAENSRDINIPNEPFPLSGRIVPSLSEGQWSYRVERSEAVTEMCFPDEHYDYDEMSKDCVFLGAYDEDRCIGLAVLRQGMFRYMYLEDLKVSRAYRGKGTGRALISAAGKIAVSAGYRGLYTIGQDNNLNACLFYLACGFRIGGFDNEVYKGTSQEGKADIFFYLDC